MTPRTRDVADLEPHRDRTVDRHAAGPIHHSAVGGKTIRRIAAGLAVGLLAVVLSGCIPPAPPLPPGPWRAQMLNDVNGLRAGKAGPVAECGRLDIAAQAHSNSMAADQFVGDSGPDGLLQNRVAAVGFGGWSVLGENVAAGQTSVAQVMTDWSNDPPHLANLLNPSFNLVGFGLASTGVGPYHYYWTQIFASGGGPC